MKRFLTFILLVLNISHLSAQSPEQVVRDYVDLLNKYFSTGNLDYRDKIVNEILNPKGADGKRVACRIDDKISQKIALSDNNEGIDNITPSRYITKLGRQNSDCGKCLKFQILTINSETRGGQKFVLAKLQFSTNSGTEILYNKFAIVGNGIGYILEDKEAELLDKMNSGNKPAQNVSQRQDNKPSTVTNNNSSVATHEYVDLGLPSGTLWATTNIGADCLSLKKVDSKTMSYLCIKTAQKNAKSIMIQ